MATPYVLRIGSDVLVSVDVMDQLTGDPITSGTVTLTVSELDGTAIPNGTITLSHVPDEPGTWRGIIPRTLTDTLQRHRRYLITLTADSGVGRLLSETEAEAIVPKIV